MRFFVALLLRMTPINAVSGWALIISACGIRQYGLQFLFNQGTHSRGGLESLLGFPIGEIRGPVNRIACLNIIDRQIFAVIFEFI
jgi:hypothetical protein